jgi:hypothetical protein
MPKALRPFFRHDRRLFAQISPLIYRIIDDSYAGAADRPLFTGTLIADLRFLAKRRYLAQPHIGHYGPSGICSAGTRTSTPDAWPSGERSEGPADLLKKIPYEPFKGRVLLHTTYSEYFKENLHMFHVLDFLAEYTRHIPPKRPELIRRYGLYACRRKGR